MSLDTALGQASALVDLPWDTGEGVVDPGSFAQAAQQASINTFSGILAPAPSEMGVCKKYGTFMYGQSGYCRIIGLRYFRTEFSAPDYNFISTWNLQSPDGTIWTPTITVGGHSLVFTPGTGTVTETPVMIQTGGVMAWMPSIANDGTLTLTPMTYDRNSMVGAALMDANCRTFSLFVTKDGEFDIAYYIRAERVPPFRRLMIEIEQSARGAGKASKVGAFSLVKLGVNIQSNRVSEWNYFTKVDRIHQAHVAIEIEESSKKAFSFSWIEPQLQVLRRKPRI